MINTPNKHKEDDSLIPELAHIQAGVQSEEGEHLSEKASPDSSLHGIKTA